MPACDNVIAYSRVAHTFARVTVTSSYASRIDLPIVQRKHRPADNEPTSAQQAQILDD